MTVTGPLTFGQLSQLRDTDSQPPQGRHQVNVVRVSPLDPDVPADALRQVCRRLRDRHEGLRTTYDLRDPARPGQVVHPPGTPPPVDVPEVGTPDGEDPRAFAEELSKRMQTRLFDLTTEEPWRAVIVTVDGRPAHLVTIVHHIVADQWSDSVIAEDFRALLDGVQPPDPPGSPLALARAQQANRRPADETYLREVYRQVATASPHDAVASPKVLVNTVLDSRTGVAAATRRAEELRRSVPIPNYSMPGLILAAYCYVAHRRLDVDTILVSALTNNRWYPGTSKLVSNMVQWARIPSRRVDGQSFEEYAAALHDASLRAYRHGCYDVDLDERVRDEVARAAGPIGLEINFNYAPVEPDPMPADAPDCWVRDVPVPYHGGPACYLIANYGHRLQLTGRSRWVGFGHAAMAALLTEVHDLLT